MPLVRVGSSGMDNRKKWACIAISAMVFSSPGVPFTPTLPSRSSRSPALASSMWPATRISFSLMMPASPTSAPATITV